MRQLDEHGPRFLPQGAGDRGGKLEHDKVPHLAVGRLADTTTSAATDDAWLHGRCGRPLPYIRGNARSAGPWPVPSPIRLGCACGPHLAGADDERRAFIGEAA